MSNTLRPHRRQVLASGAALSLLTAGTARAADSDQIKMFDSHLHVVATDRVRYPRIVNPVMAGADSPGAPQPGASVQVGKPHLMLDVDQALAWMDEAGVETAAAIQRNGDYGFDNSYILDCARAHPHRFSAVVALDGEDPNAPAQLRELSAKRHIAGMGLRGPGDPHPWLDSDKALQIWATAQDLGLTMDILYAPQRFSAETHRAILRVAQKFPRVRIVVDHLGWPALGGAPDFGLENSPAGWFSQPNLFFKFSATNLYILEEAKIPERPYMRFLVDRVGAKRILWGSDIGTAGGSYLELTQRARAATANLTPAEQRQVLRETGMTVFPPRRLRPPGREYSSDLKPSDFPEMASLQVGSVP